MNSPATELNNQLTQIEEIVSNLIASKENLENLENLLETNMETAKLNKELGYVISTLYLANAKLGGKLKKNDKVLSNMKKIQERADRIKKIETSEKDKQEKEKSQLKNQYKKLTNQ